MDEEVQLTVVFRYKVDPGGAGYPNCTTVAMCAAQDMQACIDRPESLTELIELLMEKQGVDEAVFEVFS